MEKSIEEIASKRGYQVAENGLLLNPKLKVVGSLNPTTGYQETNIRLNGKTKHFTTHRLQAFQKYGKLLFNLGIVTRHKDGDKLNNSWDNILIGSHSQNALDIPKQIRVKRAFHAASYLKKYDNQQIIDFYSNCKSYKKTMTEFEISSKGTLHYILNSN